MNTTVAPDPVQKGRQPPPPPSALNKLFDRLNRDYFGGRKPRYRVERRTLRGSSRGYCDSARRRILIDSRLDGDELAATLLHEMCHIGLPAGHGPRFNDRIRALLARVPGGVARILALDLQPGTPLRVVVHDALESLAMEYPTLSWAMVRRSLVEHVMPYTGSAQERRQQKPVLAWARREWTKVSRLYAAIEHTVSRTKEHNSKHGRKP